MTHRSKQVHYRQFANDRPCIKCTGVAQVLSPVGTPDGTDLIATQFELMVTLIVRPSRMKASPGIIQ